MPPQGDCWVGAWRRLLQLRPQKQRRGCFSARGLLQPPRRWVPAGLLSPGSGAGRPCVATGGGAAPRVWTRGSASSREEARQPAGSRGHQGAMTITRGGVPAGAVTPVWMHLPFRLASPSSPRQALQTVGVSHAILPRRAPIACGKRGPPHTWPGLQSPPLPHAACHRHAGDIIHSVVVRLIGDTPRPTSVGGTLPTFLFSAPQNRHGPQGSISPIEVPVFLQERQSSWRRQTRLEC